MKIPPLLVSTTTGRTLPGDGNNIGGGGHGPRKHPNEILSWEEMDVRGKRNLAEQISDAVLEALSGLNITNNNIIINNMDSEQISRYVDKKRLKMITSFK